MAIFKITALDGSAAMVVRARCLTCARTVAIEHAGPEGAKVWASREHSSVDLVRESDRSGLILRTNNGN